MHIRSKSFRSMLSFGPCAWVYGSETPVTRIAAFGNISWKVAMNGIDPPTPISTGATPSQAAVNAARAAFRGAWDGTDPVDIGVGGSIPFIATFQEMFPEAAILVTGVEDPHARAHGPNESLHLGEFARVCLAEALLLAKVAEAGANRS